MTKEKLKERVKALVTKIEGIYHPDIEKNIKRFLELTIEGIEGPDVKKLKNNIITALETIENAEDKAGKLAKLEKKTALVSTIRKTIDKIERLEIDLSKADDNATEEMISEIEQLTNEIEALLKSEKKEAS